MNADVNDQFYFLFQKNVNWNLETVEQDRSVSHLVQKLTFRCYVLHSVETTENLQITSLIPKLQTSYYGELKVEVYEGS